MSDTLLTWLLGALTGAVPIVVSKVLGRMESRSLMRRQVQALDLAKKRVEFVNSWMGARKTCVPRELFEGVSQEAAKELEEIRESLKKSLQTGDGNEVRTYRARPFIQRLLLAYKPTKMAGWWWRTTYYMWTSAVLASVIEGILYKNYFTGRNEQGEFSIGFLFGHILGTLMIFLPSVFFHSRAVRSDESSLPS